MISAAFLICALSLPALSADRTKLMGVDLTFFKFLEQMVPEYKLRPGEEKYKMVAVTEPVESWDTLTHYASQVVPGGFLLVELRKESLKRWLKNQGWEILPFYWHQKAIYRRGHGNTRVGA